MKISMNLKACCFNTNKEVLCMIKILNTTETVHDPWQVDNNRNIILQPDNCILSHTHGYNVDAKYNNCKKSKGCKLCGIFWSLQSKSYWLSVCIFLYQFIFIYYNSSYAATALRVFSITVWDWYIWNFAWLELYQKSFFMPATLYPCILWLLP
jgi:hypothetical protein